MKYISTRDFSAAGGAVSFSEAILHCVPKDGGLYVPAYEENLRPWILYMNESTSFSSIAGAMTSALIKEEFSPIISEAIAVKAFPFSPVLKKLNDNLYVMELFNGPTGCYKDFSLGYFASCLEHILLMQEKESVVVCVSNAETGASLSHALKGHKHIKALVLFPKGQARGFSEEDCVWNGGNLYPVEIDGTETDCFNLVRALFGNKELAAEKNLTLANSVNIGRLLPLCFSYVWAFSRLKKQVYGDIYYAVEAGNYGDLCAGLYSWKFSLPVNGFITNCTDSLVLDGKDKCSLMDSVVPLEKRMEPDIANPSNIERLEQIFQTSPAVLKGLVFPAKVTDKDREEACKEAFVRYGYLLDSDTAAAYAAVKHRESMITEDEGAAVIIAKNHPAFDAEKIRYWCGEIPQFPENVRAALSSEAKAETIAPDSAALQRIVESL